jgi:hypothetical protein
VKVTVDTNKRAGMLVKYITIYSNDRMTPLRTLSLSLNVTPKAGGGR